MLSIAVIIVTHNGSKWINRCLKSIMESTIHSTIIVIDNNSTDDTCSIVNNNFLNVLLIRLDENLGFGQANNIGIKQALKINSDYIFLLNQDAWVNPNTLQGLVDISRNNPDFYVLSPLHLNGDGLQLDYYFSHYATPENCKNFYSDAIVKRDKMDEIYNIKFVNAAMWLMPKSCIMNIGGFDPIFFHYGEDVDFINRIHFHGYKAGICSNFFGFHDRTQEIFDINKLSSTKRKPRKEIEYLIILKNINLSLEKCFTQLFIKFLNAFFKALMMFKINKALEELYTILNVLWKLRFIIKQRNTCRSRTQNYL